jgi:hypothetical protein
MALGGPCVRAIYASVGDNIRSGQDVRLRWFPGRGGDYDRQVTVAAHVGIGAESTS